MTTAPTCRVCGADCRHRNGKPIPGARRCLRCSETDAPPPEPEKRGVTQGDVLAALQAGCRTANDVARVVRLTPQGASAHLRSMAAAGLIARERRPKPEPDLWAPTA